MDVKFSNTTSANLDNVSIVDGQIIALSDKSGLYYDLGGNRYNVFPYVVSSSVASGGTNIVTGGGVYTYAAPKDHKSTATTYGRGNATYYGHVKVSDNYETSAGSAAAGVAASSFVVSSMWRTFLARHDHICVPFSSIPTRSDYFSDITDARGAELVAYAVITGVPRYYDSSAGMTEGYSKCLYQISGSFKISSDMSGTSGNKSTLFVLGSTLRSIVGTSTVAGHAIGRAVPTSSNEGTDILLQGDIMRIVIPPSGKLGAGKYFFSISYLATS